MNIRSITSFVKKFCAFFILISLIGVQLKVPVGAAVNASYVIGAGDFKYEYKDLLNYYQIYSTDYYRNSITYQIDALGGTIAYESYNSLNDQYTDIIVKLAELNAAKVSLVAYRDSLTQSQVVALTGTDTVVTAAADINTEVDNSEVIAEINNQIATIDVQIVQYNISIGSAETNMADAKLQEEVAKFYDTFQCVILQEAQNKLSNDFLKKSYGLILTKEQQDYHQAYQKYLEMVKEIEIIKCRLGLSELSAIDTADLNIIKNGALIEKDKALFYTTFSSIKVDTNINDSSTILLPFTFVKKTYELNQTVDRFTYNNASVLQLQNFIKSYQNYLISSGVKSDSLRKQIGLKIKDYQLQSDTLKMNIKSYVKEAMQSYDNAFKSLDAADKELVLKTKRCDIVTAKKNHKRATELELRQAINEKEAAEVAYYQCCYEIVVWQNILDNYIYGATT